MSWFGLEEIERARAGAEVEDVVAEVPESAAGGVMERLAARKGRMEAMEHRGDRVLLRYVAPSRGLFGYRGEFLKMIERAKQLSGQ